MDNNEISEAGKGCAGCIAVIAFFIVCLGAWALVVAVTVAAARWAGG